MNAGLTQADSLFPLELYIFTYVCLIVGLSVCQLGGTKGTVCIIGDHLNSNSIQYFIKSSSHSELDLCDPNVYQLFNVDVQSVSIVPHVSFLHLLLVWKSNSCMHNIEGGSAFACLHLFFIFCFNIK